MNFSEICAIAGKGGLFKVLKPTRAGVIVESINEPGKKMVANSNSRVSILQEISIYTNDDEGACPLRDVMLKIREEFGDDPGVGSTSSSEELRAFMKHVLPDHDEERVYTSDIKKLVSWYKTLLEKAPEVFEAEENEDTPAEAEEN
ncbi:MULTISPECIES: DUF5606 domain-containing protein [Persicobacter]|uniref:DUF5606 domain-containing protein n=1 Tax=Persicobacter diffluens TaxID=981 RepID=A0AAN4VVF9_9BACT|nr:DUF5606 domain-containing protein [Persicobacter sp. CCB-QB2]GJM60142.1 hypothetical protein PEDI_06940 [Persicobacter diffluens]